MAFDKNLDWTFKHVEQGDKLYDVYTSAQIKEKFDSRGVDLKAYVDRFIDYLQSDEGISSIGSVNDNLEEKLLAIENGTIDSISVTNNILTFSMHGGDNISISLPETGMTDQEKSEFNTLKTMVNGIPNNVVYDDSTGNLTISVVDKQGLDGYSPTAVVTQGTGSATITITDKNGTTTATVHDGTSGTGGTTDYESLTNKPSIGELTDLDTTAKTDLVSAINEAYHAGSDIVKTVSNISTISSATGVVTLKNGTEYDNSNAAVLFASNIKIDGNGATIKNCELKVNGNIDFEIDNAVLDNCTITVSQDCKSFIVRNCTIKNNSNNSIAVWHKADVVIIEGNIIDNVTPLTTGDYNINNNGSGIFFYTTADLPYVKIFNNKITNIYGGAAIYLNASFKNIDVNNNTIDTIYQRGINLWNTTSAVGFIRNNVIKNCGVLKDAGTNQGVGCNGIYTNVTLKSLSIIGNYIENVYENGIEGDYKCVKDNTIISTAASSVHTTPSPEGIYSAGSGKTIITGNLIINPGGHGIYHYGTGDITDVVIKNNIIKRDTLSTTYAGISYRGASGSLNNFDISGNTITNFNYGIELQVPNKNDVKMRNNDFITCAADIYNTDAFMSGMKLDYTTELIKDPYFTEWTSDTALTNWTVANATISKETNGNLNVPVITASDTYNGRINQTIIAPTDGLLQLIITYKSATGLYLKKYVYSGETLTNAVSKTCEASTDFKTVYFLIKAKGKMLLEFGNLATANDTVTLKEVHCFITKEV